MYKLILLFIFLRFSVGQLDLNYTSFYESEKYTNYIEHASNLYDELFNKRSYNKYLSPVYGLVDNATDEDPPPPLLVNFRLEHLQDSQSQLLSACLQLRATWIDPRLTWKSVDYGGMKDLYVNADTTWIPDNQFGNVKILDDVLPGAGKAVQISNNGSIQMVNVYYLEIACQIVIKNFPFDNQTCEMPLLSFLYTGTLVQTNLTTDPNTIDARITELGNGEWQSIGIEQLSAPFGKQQICFMRLKLKRVPNYYIYVIAIPCFIITLLSIVGMFWTQNVESEQLGKLGIGLTSLVSMTVLLDLLSSSIPKTAVFPLLGIYVVSCVGIIAVACLLVMICSAKDPRKRSSAEIKKELEAEKSLPKNERIWKRMKDELFHRHHLFQIILHGINLSVSIWFISYWK